jgi:mono/diheme cytochrome c family protein
VAKAEIATPQSSKGCRLIQVARFITGKHTLAWAALRPMPAFHWQAQACQSCHMPNYQQWAADCAVILKGLGVLDPEGKPAARLEVVKQVRVARLTQEDWQKERDRMLGACRQCHSLNFARAELAKGDEMIRQADRLMAEAIETVAGLYRGGIPFWYGWSDMQRSLTEIEHEAHELRARHKR